MARGNVEKMGKELLVDAPVAAGYALLANWLFRKAGLSYGTRAAVSAVAGGVIGYGLVRSGLESMGKTVAVTGVAAGIIYGASEISTRMFLGSPDSRQSLPSGSTGTGTGTGGGRPALGAGAPAGNQHEQFLGSNAVPMRRSSK